MSEMVGMAKQSTEQSIRRLLVTFSHVPDDKLNWRPAPGSKTAIEIMAHCATSNAWLAGLLAGSPDRPQNMEDAMARGAQAQAAIKTREDAVNATQDACKAIVAALDTLTPEQIASEVDGVFMKAPMPFFMFLGARHADGHACQIDYLQTMWDDQVFHFND